MQETARYGYESREGVVHYYKIKYLDAGKKTFRFAQIKNGVEVLNLDGVTRIPYAYPRVLDAFEEGAPLFYVEGEKDADALNTLGFHTTTLGGANDLKAALKSNPVLPNYFKDVSELVIIPDNDAPGKKLAVDVFEALEHCFINGIKVLELPNVPDKGDVSDWLETCGEDKAREFSALADKYGKPFSNELRIKWKGAQGPSRPQYVADVYTKYNNLMSLLSGVKSRGPESFLAKCPTHQDDTASLGVTIKGDKIAMNCLAHCSTDNILQAIGLTYADLFADESRPSVEAIAVARESILREIPESIEEMDFSRLPSVLTNYVNECKQITSGSPTSAAIALITIVGGYLGQNCRFPGYFGHTLYPNIWALSIASSGSFKSTMVKMASKKLRLDDSVHLNQIRDYQKCQDAFKPNDDDWTELEAQIKESQGQTLALPERITLEALFSEFRHRSKGVWLPDEFSSWLKMTTAGYNEGMKNMLTELYDPDQAIKKITKSGGLEVMENAFISICSTSTIEFITGHNPKERLIGVEDAKTGFFARFLLFRVPDLHRTPPALPVESKILEETQAFWDFAELCDRFTNTNDPINMRFSKEAREHFNGWHNGIWDLSSIKDKEPYLYDLLRSYASRWSPACIKLSMILQQCLEPGMDIITNRALEGAISVLDFVIQSTKQLFRRELGESYVDSTRRKLLEYIANKQKEHEGGVPWSKITMSRCIKNASAKKYMEIVDDLEESGKLIKIPGARKKDVKIMLAA